MTNKEALIAEVPGNTPDGFIEKALVDNGVTGSDTYGTGDSEKIDYCVIAVLKRLLSDPDITEGGYSIRFDRGAVEKRLKYLVTQYGLTDILGDLKPTVTGRNVW